MSRTRQALLAGVALAALVAVAYGAVVATSATCHRFSPQRSCAPSGLSYQSPVTASVGVPIARMTPNVSGFVLLYLASPSLPKGLSLSPFTGVISGTPRTPAATRAYTITALNLAGYAQFALTLTVQGVTPPTALSYPATVPLLIGKPMAALTPSVTGVVTSYSIVPALPGGLLLDAASGVVSGTPAQLSTSTQYVVTAANAGGETSATLTLKVEASPTVHLTATATDPQGFALTYRWKTTDGTVLQSNGAEADWQLPSGPGVHFAYVLVSNDHGGYTERRIAIITDDIGNPTQAVGPMSHGLPAGPAVPAGPGRVTMTGGQFNPPSHRADLVASSSYGIMTGMRDVKVFMSGPNAGDRYPATGFLDTNADGAFYVPRNDTLYTYNCSFDGGASFLDCGFPGALTHVVGGFIQPRLVGAPSYSWGTAALADGSVCGTNNEFFGIEATATATVLDASGIVVQGPIRAGHLGDFSIAQLPGQATVVLGCEGNAPQSVPMYNGQLGTFTFAASQPVVSDIVGDFNGAPIGVFLPPPSGFPSDGIEDPSKYLSFRGLDSRLSACKYYEAIGAVGGCNTDGTFVDPVSFDDWRRDAQIDGFAPAAAPPTYVATYINRVDLNLTRNHHSISYGAGNTSAYVCNSLGPKVLDAGQPEINSVVDAAVAGRNLVACVAMDYKAWPGVNGGAPFTRFLTFGPNGQLLASVNLDGRGEKFIPGTCVACHGGDKYIVRFPTDGSGTADIGAHFLPYDPNNFSFADQPGLTLADQEEAIYALNQNVLLAGPNSATQELINGWYAGGHVADPNFVPPLWKAWPGPNGPVDFSAAYLKAFAPACRTCHVAAYPQIAQAPFGQNDSQDYFCKPSFSMPITGYSMPNSLVTFNRFWLSGNAADGGQPAAIAQMMQQFSALYGLAQPTSCSYPP